MIIDNDRNLVFLNTAPEVVGAHSLLEYEISRNPNNVIARRLQKDLPSPITAKISETSEGYIEPAFAMGPVATHGLAKVVAELKEKKTYVPLGQRARAIKAARSLSRLLPEDMDVEIDLTVASPHLAEASS